MDLIVIIIIIIMRQFFVVQLNVNENCCVSQDSSVGIATGYGVDGWGSIPGITRFLFLFHSLQTVSGAHPASYPMDTGGSFAVVNLTGT
jgi:hypothetical protein